MVKYVECNVFTFRLSSGASRPIRGEITSPEMMIERRQFPFHRQAECISAALSVTVKEIERQHLRNFFINVWAGFVEMSIPTTFTHVSSGRNANIDVFHKGRIHDSRFREKFIYNDTVESPRKLLLRRKVRIFRFFFTFLVTLDT